MRRMLAILAATAGLAVTVIVIAALIWFNALFEERGAQPVESVAGALGAKRVLAVFAHPDDEQLVTGLLHRAAIDDGAYVAMITATQGEAGTQMPVVARQRELGIIRTAEVLKSGFALGVKDQEVWNYADGGVEAVPFLTLTAAIIKAFHRYEPDLVVTFWPESGATGHPDHRRIGLAVAEAVRQFEGIHVYRGPKHVAYTLMPRRVMRQLGGERGAFVAEHQPEPNFSMPGETGLKQRGWDIHASQGDFVREVYGVPANVLYAFFDKEFYYVEALQEAPE